VIVTIALVAEIAAVAYCCIYKNLKGKEVRLPKVNKPFKEYIKKYISYSEMSQRYPSASFGVDDQNQQDYSLITDQSGLTITNPFIVMTHGDRQFTLMDL